MSSIAKDLTTLAMYTLIVDQMRNLNDALPVMTENMTTGLKHLDKAREEVRALNIYAKRINDAMAVIEATVRTRQENKS